MGPDFTPPPWELYDQRLLNKILFIRLLGPFLLAIKQDTPSLFPRMPCYCPISDDNKIVNINFKSDCPRRVFDVNIRIVKLVWWTPGGVETQHVSKRSSNKWKYLSFGILDFIGFSVKIRDFKSGFTFLSHISFAIWSLAIINVGVRLLEGCNQDAQILQVLCITDKSIVKH